MSTNTPNIGWLFFKDYYQDFNFKNSSDKYQENWFNDKNKIIFQQSLNTASSTLIKVKTATPIELTTVYPGLATGVGITHESKSKGEIKLGFAFDHTTGLPYLPGSSVKGLLRSVFPQKTIDSKKAHPNIREYLITLLEDIELGDSKALLESHFKKQLGDVHFDFPEKEKEINNLFIDVLEREIFEGFQPQKKKKVEADKKTWEYLPVSIYNRDIFHDAYPLETTKKSGRFLGLDFITPHLEPLKNPTPIQFMKILPGVTMQFQFHLQDGIITAEKKRQLFEVILKDQGIGAKTNVGYGQFKDLDDIDTADTTDDTEPEIESTSFEEGQSVMGIVEAIDLANNRVTFRIKGKPTSPQQLSKKQVYQLSKGDKIDLTVKKLDEAGNIKYINIAKK